LYEILAGIFVGIFAVISDILGLLKILYSACFDAPAV